MIRIRRSTASVVSLAGSVIGHSGAEEIHEGGNDAEPGEDRDQPRLRSEQIVQPPSNEGAGADGSRKKHSDRVSIREEDRVASLSIVIGWHGRSRRARRPPATR